MSAIWIFHGRFLKVFYNIFCRITENILRYFLSYWCNVVASFLWNMDRNSSVQYFELCVNSCPLQSTYELPPEPNVLRIRVFTILWPKVPLLLPAPKGECGFFGPGIMKNRIRNIGIKRATQEHMFAIHAPTALVAIYTCSGLANSLPPLLLCNIRLKTF